MQRFGDYELLEEVARGGMGIVYRARQISLNRTVAVKLLPFSSLTGAEFIKRFRAEASAAAALRHPNIVTVHEVGVSGGQHYLVMNFVSGPPLGRLVDEGPLAPRRAATYLKGIAEAVHHAHEQGILHRDLKPSNVLIDEDDQPQITDFGLAKRLDGESSLTLTGQALGSPGYMPPEQALAEHSKVTRRSDVYGLGAMLYHLLTGRPPFQAGTLNQAIHQVVDREPVAPDLLNPGVPRDLQTICLKCLEKEPERRYHTAQEVAGELERFLEGRPIRARAIGPWGKAWRWCRRRPVLAGLSVALILTFAAGLTGVLWQWRRAVANEWLSLQNAYAADMNQAQRSLEEGDFGTALGLLNKYRPEQSSPTALGARSPADLRGWEWRYLWGLCQSDERFTLCRYPAWVGAVDVSPDGNILAVQRGDGLIALWDLPGGREITNLPASGPRGTVSFSPSGGLLAAANSRPSREIEVSLWEPGSLAAKPGLPHDAPVVALTFSPNGNFLATQDSRETVRVWELKSRQVLKEYPGPGNWPSVDSPWGGVLQFSPDGRWLAFQHELSSIRVVNWGAETNSPATLPRAESVSDNPMLQRVTTVAFSPDGRLLAWGLGSGTIRLWDVDKAESAGELIGHDNAVLALAFTPEGTQLASASSDQTLRIWDLADHVQVRLLRGNESEVWGLDLLPDGKTLVSGGKDGSVRFWGLTDPPVAPSHRLLPAFLLQFGPVSGQCIALDPGEDTVGLWDTRSLERMGTVSKLGNHIWGFGLSPDWKWLAVARWEGSSVQIWDWRTRTVAAKLEVPWRPNEVGFTARGKFAYAQRKVPRSADKLGQAPAWKLWRSGIWAEVALPLDKLKPNIWSASMSPDDRLLAVGYEDGGIELRTFPDLQLVGALSGYSARVQSISFSPDGRWLSAASWGDFVKVWDVQRRNVVMTLRGHFTQTFYVTFSPDSKRLAVGGLGGGGAEPQVKLWDLATQRELLTLPGGCWNLNWSPDGNTLAASQRRDSKRTHVWRAPSWQEIEAKENADSLD